jgi:hypothetical protein
MTDEEYEAACDRWEQHFALLSAYGDDEAKMVAVFEAMGWDVTDPDAGGDVLLAVDRLGRQLVCAIKGLAGARLPGAPMSEERAKVEAEAWGSDLAAEAERFRGKRR